MKADGLFFMCVKINMTWDTYFNCKGIVSRDEYF
jgi:hypothetical protein